MRVAIPFTHYLGYVYRYSFEPRWLLVGTLTLFALTLGSSLGLGIVNPQREHSTGEGFVTTRRRGVCMRWVRATAAIAAVTALLIALPSTGLGVARPAPEGFPVRIVSYNIFMGLGADVNLDLDRLADQIARQKPDVVALQEVSRGWFTSGSIDLLPRLAERLGYSYHFFPAADDTWGNAILTNVPSEEYTTGLLPRGSAAMNRGWGGALLKLGDGERMLVVVSHLHHPYDGQPLREEQAQVLSERTLALAEHHQIPFTVLVGDMNAEADSEELLPVQSFFWDALADDPLPTYPSWAPQQRIDHIFTSEALQASDPAVFGGPASDHLGIAVSLKPAEIR